ncbi:GNAT family N-acetyltransferase [Mycoplasmatota bacterium zrk1]
MKIELRELSVFDGSDIYELLQDIPNDENGYINKVNGMTYEEYKNWLHRKEKEKVHSPLESWKVPTTIFWLYIDNYPVGCGKLRHYLNDKMRESGGNIGYAIRKKQRCKGYGSLLLKEIVKRAEKMGINERLLTIRNENIASIRVTTKSGGVVKRKNSERTYFSI